MNFHWHRICIYRLKEAKAYIESYLEKYHGVEIIWSIKEQAKKDGYVKTMLNRIRYIPELKSPNYNIRQFGERVALNITDTRYGGGYYKACNGES